MRLAVAALIIKHKMKLSDEEVVAMIQENIYVQYFVGFPAFTTKPAFDPSLFVTLRRRMGAEKFDRMNQAIIRTAQNKPKPSKDKRKENYPDLGGAAQVKGRKKASRTGSEQPHRGKLKLDATVADQRIKEIKDFCFSGRLSCHRYSANFFRLILSCLAYEVLRSLRDRLPRSLKIYVFGCGPFNLSACICSKSRPRSK